MIFEISIIIYPMIKGIRIIIIYPIYLESRELFPYSYQSISLILFNLIKMKKNSINPIQSSEIQDSNLDLSIDQINNDIDQNEENQMIDEILNKMEESEIKEEKKKSIRLYNSPRYKSGKIEDLSSIQFPISWMNGESKIEYQNRFGNLKIGDIINFRLNPNNKNKYPSGKILFFLIQENGFWIKYQSIDGKSYFKNLNLFDGLSNESEIKEFEERLKSNLESQKLEKSEK